MCIRGVNGSTCYVLKFSKLNLTVQSSDENASNGAIITPVKVLYPTDSSKTSLVKPALSEWKSETENWKTEFSVP